MMNTKIEAPDKYSEMRKLFPELEALHMHVHGVYKEIATISVEILALDGKSGKEAGQKILYLANITETLRLALTKSAKELDDLNKAIIRFGESNNMKFVKREEN